MSRTALFANAFNGLIKKAREEADQQKSVIAKELEQARQQFTAAQERVADLEAVREEFRRFHRRI